MARDQLGLPDHRSHGQLLENPAGGVRIPLVGSALLVLGATLLSFPICLGAAVYLAEYMDERHPLTRMVRLGLEVLAGVPSVVFGMFGLAVFSISAFTFLSTPAPRALRRRSGVRSSSR